MTRHGIYYISGGRRCRVPSNGRLTPVSSVFPSFVYRPSAVRLECISVFRLPSVWSVFSARRLPFDCRLSMICLKFACPSVRRSAFAAAHWSPGGPSSRHGPGHGYTPCGAPIPSVTTRIAAGREPALLPGLYLAVWTVWIALRPSAIGARAPPPASALCCFCSLLLLPSAASALCCHCPPLLLLSAASVTAASAAVLAEGVSVSGTTRSRAYIRHHNSQKTLY